MRLRTYEYKMRWNRKVANNKTDRSGCVSVTICYNNSAKGRHHFTGWIYRNSDNSVIPLLASVALQKHPDFKSG